MYNARMNLDNNKTYSQTERFFDIYIFFVLNDDEFQTKFNISLRHANLYKACVFMDYLLKH